MLKTGNPTEYLDFIYRGKTKMYRKDTRVAEKGNNIILYEITNSPSITTVEGDQIVDLQSPCTGNSLLKYLNTTP